MTQFMIRTGSWDELQNDARLIREQVFIHEQQITPEDEWDAEDAIALHFLVLDQHHKPTYIILIFSFSF